MSGTGHAVVSGDLGLTNESKKAIFKRYWDVIAATGELVDQCCIFRKQAHVAMFAQLRHFDASSVGALDVKFKQLDAQGSTQTLSISLVKFRMGMRNIFVRYGVECLHSRDYGVPIFHGLRTWPNLDQLLAYYEPHVLDRHVYLPFLDAEIDGMRRWFLTLTLFCRKAVKIQLAVLVDLADWMDKFDHGYDIFFVEFKVLLGLRQAAQMMVDVCRYTT